MPSAAPRAPASIGSPSARARAMCLNVADLARFHPGVLEGLADHSLLRRTVWNRQAAGAAIVIDGGSSNQGENIVSDPPGRSRDA